MAWGAEAPHACHTCHRSGRGGAERTRRPDAPGPRSPWPHPRAAVHGTCARAHAETYNDGRHDPRHQDHEPQATRRACGRRGEQPASRGWWDRNADEYQDEHGSFLGDDRFVWGPEGLDEEDARLLGPAGSLEGRDVLEIGAGAAQCSRWLAAQGARPVALDLSHRQLQHALRIGAGGDGFRWWRRTRARCRSGTAPSTWPARRTGRCPSSPTPCRVFGRCAGCCGRAAGGCSP